MLAIIFLAGNLGFTLNAISWPEIHEALECFLSDLDISPTNMEIYEKLFCLFLWKRRNIQLSGGVEVVRNRSLVWDWIILKRFKVFIELKGPSIKSASRKCEFFSACLLTPRSRVRMNRITWNLRWLFCQIWEKFRVQFGDYPSSKICIFDSCKFQKNFSNFWSTHCIAIKSGKIQTLKKADGRKS